MRRWFPVAAALIFCVPQARAGGKVVLDLWDIAYLGDARAGYVHTSAKEIERDGKKAIETTIRVRLTVKRNNDVIEMAMDTGAVETPAGKVLAVSTKHYSAKQLRLQIDGTVVGNRLQLMLNGAKRLQDAPWNDAVVGLFKQETLFKDHPLKPGEKFTYQSFEPSINLVMKVEVVAKGYREVQLKGAKEKRKLLLVEVIPEKLTAPDKVTKVQLPVKQAWLDANMQAVKSEVEVPGLGPVVVYRTTKEKALAPAPIAQLADIGVNQRVRLKSRILNAHDTTAATYRLTVRNDDDVGTTFSRDDRQQVKKVQGNTFELHVTSKRATGDGDNTAPAAEFLKSSYFITSDDAKVKELARVAIGDVVDPWKKAARIERWVHLNMNFSNDEALATADHVARTLKGDCTEYAMLTAAMCRAAGVPSRTALGLVYAEERGAPFFAFHMWTEVWVKGRWIAIDSTIGKGFVGAAHLKITDHSWHDERTMTPLFPVIRVVGRVNIEVMSTTR